MYIKQLLQDYVLYAFTLNPKIGNNRQISGPRNISRGTFAFVDDLLNERGEVAGPHAETRIDTDTNAARFQTRPKFKVPVSTDSSARRFSGQQWLHTRVFQARENGLKGDAFASLPFQQVDSNQHSTLYEMPFQEGLNLDRAITLVAEGGSK